MMASRDIWLPYSELADHSDGQIATGWSGMPQAIHDDVLFNMTALRQGVVKWGGYNTLKVGAVIGDTDHYDVDVDGADGSGVGSAVGGVTHAATAADSTSKSRPELNGLDQRNGELEINWNTNALNSELSLSEQHDPSAYADKLNKLVRSEAMKSVWRHNTMDALWDRNTLLSTSYLIIDSTLRPDSVSVQETSVFASNPIVAQIGFIALLKLIGTVGKAYASQAYCELFYEEKTEPLLDPFFLSMRPTRAAIASAALSRRLVAPASKSV